MALTTIGLRGHIVECLRQAGHAELNEYTGPIELVPMLVELSVANRPNVDSVKFHFLSHRRNAQETLTRQRASPTPARDNAVFGRDDVVYDEAADDYNHMQHLSVAAEIVAKEEE